MSEQTPTILAKILMTARQEVERRKAQVPVETLVREAALWSREHALAAALGGEGISLIAEIKRRSPSAGAIREGVDVAQVAATYERAGASAISVLTEGPHFGGSLGDLRAARAASSLPILRKDFIVDPYQLHEAAAAGASAVLLIVAALRDEELSSLHSEADEMGLDVLVEVHDESEALRAREIGARLVGVNNRDLRDFSVDVGRTFSLLSELGEDALIVSESGISSAAQIDELERRGVSAVLIGETLMRAGDPAAALRELMGRRVASEQDRTARF